MTAVVERSRELPVVVDFWAEWCGPCRQLGPALEAAVAKRAGKVELAKVDVDANQSLAASFGVRGIPAVKAFRDGDVVAEFTGAIPPAEIEGFLDGLVPSPADELVAAGDEQSLREALAIDPRIPGPPRSSAASCSSAARPSEAAELLEPLAGDFLAEGLAARARLAAANGDGDAEAADARATPSPPGTRAIRRRRWRRFRTAFAAEHDPDRRDLIRRVMVGDLHRARRRPRARARAPSPPRSGAQLTRRPDRRSIDPIAAPASRSPSAPASSRSSPPACCRWCPATCRR